MHRHRSSRSIHALSPATTQALVKQFSSRAAEPDTASQSSESPDSLYSNGSPVFPDQAFEFDTASQNAEVEEHDEDEYESLMGSADRGDGEDFGGGGWSRWPEAGLGTEMGWTPSPKSMGRKASIISISPRGSVSNRGSASGRRPSTPCSKLRQGDGDRRDSNPSLLGFDLAERRLSVRSLSSPRRRSSALSNGSSLDPLEAARLRNIASMDQLGRRFSEVVEVTMPSDTESYEDDSFDYASRARAALQSPWTPGTCTDDEDDSEIMTAPYVPTPDMPFRRPLLLSNYPLPTSVRDEVPYETPTDTPADMSSLNSAASSPSLLRRPLPAPHMLLATPPPPAQPLDILRGRQRPGFPRAATDYQFPPRSDGVPIGAGPPRPSLARAISTPLFSAPQKTQPIALGMEKRAAGSFPVVRSTPLGTSPLRSSTRRQSLSSNGDSRRVSLSNGGTGEVRRSSLEPRRLSVDSRRPSVAERRMSIVNGTCPAPRRLSADTRRSSNARGSAGSRRSSNGSINSRRGSGADMKRTTSSRRSSSMSRRSSAASFGEYAYLGPQIMIDTPAPLEPSAASRLGPSVTPPAARLRPNAPSSIALPLPFSVTSASPSKHPITPSGTSRFNPLETFLGISNTGSSYTPTPGTTDLFTPRGGSFTFDATPKSNTTSVMDRPRPISPPEFRMSFPLSPKRWQDRASPKSPARPVDSGFRSPHSGAGSSSGSGSGSGSSDTCAEVPVQVEEAVKEMSSPTRARLSVVRKAVPKLTTPELQSAERIGDSDSLKRDRATRGHQRNYYRRGAVELFTPSDDTLPRPPMTRRITAIDTLERSHPSRPEPRRQATYDDRPVHHATPSHTSPPGDRYQRTAQVSFAEQSHQVKVTSRPTIHRAASASALSRFFHGRSKSSSTAPSASMAPAPVSQAEKPLKPVLVRPISIEGYMRAPGNDQAVRHAGHMSGRQGSGFDMSSTNPQMPRQRSERA